MYNLRSVALSASRRHFAFLNDKWWSVCYNHSKNLNLLTKLSTRPFSYTQAISGGNSLNRHLQTENAHFKKLHNRQVERKQMKEEKAELDNSLKENINPEDIFGDGVATQGSNEFKESESLQMKSEGAETEWSDSFGEMAAEADPAFRTQLYRDMAEDEDTEEIHIPLAASRYNKVPWWYGKQIEKLGAEGKITDAIAILEDQMLVKDRIKPTEYCFTVLIGCLGRVGYTKKAFSLFNQMKKMGIIPSVATYTALFNACGNSPLKDGLPRATKLRALMKEKQIEPNLINYKAMIKAFGKGGDLLTAFSLMDELCEKYTPDGEVFSFLLMACISDKEAGLKHAIEVWRRLRKRKLTIDTQHYNLLLHAVKDCGVGDQDYVQSLIHSVPRTQADASLKIESEQHRTMAGKELTLDAMTADDHTSTDKGTENSVGNSGLTRSPRVDALTTSSRLTTGKHRDKVTALNISSEVTTGKRDDVLAGLTSSSEVSTRTTHKGCSFQHSVSGMNADVPNLLNPRAKFREVVLLKCVTTPVEKFLLLGGLPGFFRHMTSDQATPDIKTFTQCIELIPATRQAEQELISAASAYKVNLDTDFFNLVIRKRNKRGDIEGAKAILEHMSAQNLKPNLMTFGCLALGCFSKRDGLALLHDMKQAGFLPNMTIYNTLSWRSANDFFYKIEILKSMKANDVQPDTKFLQHMEKALETGRRHIFDLEHHKPVPGYVQKRLYLKGFHYFRMHYKKWLQNMGVQEQEHPWTAFKKTRSQYKEE